MWTRDTDSLWLSGMETGICCAMAMSTSLSVLSASLRCNWQGKARWNIDRERKKDSAGHKEPRMKDHVQLFTGSPQSCPRCTGRPLRAVLPLLPCLSWIWPKWSTQSPCLTISPHEPSRAKLFLSLESSRSGEGCRCGTEHSTCLVICVSKSDHMQMVYIWLEHGYHALPCRFYLSCFILHTPPCPCFSHGLYLRHILSV